MLGVLPWWGWGLIIAAYAAAVIILVLAIERGRRP